MKLLFAADVKMSRFWQSPANFLVVFAVLLALTTTCRASEASSEHGGNETEAHGVHVVHVQFSYVEQPLILALFLLAVVLIKIGQSHHVLYILP